MAKKKNVKSKRNVKKNTKELIVEREENSFFPYYFIITIAIVLLFLMVYGIRVLIPTDTGWIFTDSGDILQHYVGWEAFRYGKWLFPIGLTNMVSYPINVSVVFTDSIPILAVFFKLISFMLPKTFQYLGFYGLLCFVLQGILAAKIFKKYTDSKTNVIIASILFAIIPSMIFRMFYHTALASQWLILLALETLFLYDEFNEGKKIYYIWGIISFLVSTIHLYYLLMCGIILLGYILLDILHTKKFKKSLILLGIYLSVALFFIWLLGGFTNLSGNDDFGFGLFSYNLNGLINSQGWSVFFDELPMTSYQYEGFSYLGLGVIILIVISIILSIIRFIKDRTIFKSHKNIIFSLCLISIISVFVAISPKVYLGDNLLFEMKLPSFINDLWAIFRSTGRFIWPVIHILMLISIIIIFKNLNWKYSLFILLFCTGVQILDIGSKLSDIHEFYNKSYSINEEYNLYENDYLGRIANNENINTLVFVSDDFYDSDLMIFSDWALNNSMKTNRFHFARQSFDDILMKNSVKLLENKDESVVFLFTTLDECTSYGLYCYNVPYNYYLGYINSLD